MILLQAHKDHQQITPPQLKQIPNYQTLITPTATSCPIFKATKKSSPSQQNQAHLAQSYSYQSLASP